MAAALFAREVEGLPEGVDPSSAGLLPGGSAVPREVLEVMVPYSVDLSEHRSRTVTSDLLAEADLVVGMGRRHVREAVLLAPTAWPRSFTLKELVRRARAVGARGPDDSMNTWIGALHEGRTRAGLAHHSSVDEVVDPYGGPLSGYREVAAELASLTGQLAASAWPGRSGDANRVEA